MKKIILKWLGVDSEIADLKKKIENQKEDILFLKSLVKVGADVHLNYPHSWAVICLAGKPDYVRFINLNRKDIHEIAVFLRQFKESQVNIDLPHMMPREVFSRY